MIYLKPLVFNLETNGAIFQTGVAHALLLKPRMAIGTRILFYLKYYLVPQVSFGLFLLAESVFLYGLYCAFVAP
jgi:hypothetical protein